LAGGAQAERNLHRLRVLIVVVILIVSIQAWTGDFVNVFVAPSQGVAPYSFTVAGFLQGVESLGPFLIWHALEGLLIFALSLALLLLSFRWSTKRSVRVCAALGTLFVVVAGLGGILFVLSGFSDGGSSMQMGGSFLGVYAMYFIELYFTK